MKKQSMFALASRVGQKILPWVLAAGSAACSSNSEGDPATVTEPKDLTWPCESSVAAPDFLQKIGCRKDFDALASVPLDASIPGARSGKVVLDTRNGDALYFQNSVKYPIHYDFASTNLSKSGGLEVPLLAEFNRVQYYAPDRRFLLGAVTYYEEPDIWALEVAPYDTMDATMMEKLYTAVADKVYFGPRLAFVPTSDAVAAEAKRLPAKVRIKTTDDVFAGTEYQPLNLGKTIAQLRFITAAALETEYVGARELVVLDKVPNDISVVSGMITEEFQTPLSHVNILAQNRKTPNMGLRNATSRQDLRALDGKWVELVVGANEWSIREATTAEANAFWEANKPAPVVLPPLDLEVRDLRDIKGVTVETGTKLKEAIQLATRAFGAKAANYSVLSNTADVPIRKAFAIPVYYYVQFMEENGFFKEVDALLADSSFQGSPKVRDQKLAELRERIEHAPVNTAFQDLLRQKIAQDFPNQTMRFRTSTNAEDLDGFPCAGCYDSHTGDPADWEDDLLDAVRETWAGVWFFRTFEERAYHSIDHKSVGMALLVHHNFPAEEANGVALTANPFDPTGVEPGFYVNVQWGGDYEVVHPPPGSTSDEFLYFFDSPNQPTTYLSHSNLVGEGEHVLTRAQIYDLGKALKAIHERYSPAYGPKAGNQGWFAMDVEFKYDDEESSGEPAKLLVKQARPHPGRGQ
jgi:pyruvate, water dikinase